MLAWPIILLSYFLLGNEQEAGDTIVQVNVPEVTVQAGKGADIKVFVSVKKGYHIQANDVKDEFIIPTTLEMETQNIIVTEKEIFPHSSRFKLQGTSDPLLVYEGDFLITIPIKARDVKNGKYFLTAKLNYQACDERICYAPRTIVFSVDIVITSKVV
jgi:hypothetical protein